MTLQGRSADPAELAIADPDRASVCDVSSTRKGELWEIHKYRWTSQIKLIQVLSQGLCTLSRYRSLSKQNS